MSLRRSTPCVYFATRQRPETVMRKRYKLKRRSCALCKPHKRGWDQRWTAKEGQRLENAEREMRIVVLDEKA